MPWTLLGWALCAAVVIATVGHVPLDAPFEDLFQEGEYLSPRLLIAAGQSPLLVHGGLDVWPSRLAAAWFGPARLIAGTRLVNMLLAGLAEGLLVGCVALAARRDRWPALAAVLAGLLLVNGLATDPIGLHQGSPSVRDIGLLGTMACLLLARERPRLFEPLAGLVAGLSLFWAYNRGIVAPPAVAIYALARLATTRRPDALVRTMAGLAAGIAPWIAGDAAATRWHRANILYWTRHHDLWQLPDLPGRWLAGAPFYAAMAGILILFAMRAARGRHTDATREGLPAGLALAAILLFVVEQTLDRPDVIHLRFAWPWALLVAILAREAGPTGQPWLSRRAARPLALAAAAAIVSATGMLAVEGARNLHRSQAGLPEDGRIVAPDILATARSLRARAGGCTYLLDNSAAFYHLAGVPSCSASMIPIYADRTTESGLIGDLGRRRPAVIVGASASWQFRIDRRDYRSRLPRLAAWIGRHYRSDRRIGRFQLLRRDL